MKKNKKIFLLFLFLIIVFISIGIGVRYLKKEDIEKMREEEIKRMATIFYEKYYYPNLPKEEKERNEFLQKFSTSGIKISLENIIKYGNIEEIIEEVQTCNQTTTKILIFPNYPYTIEDYHIKIECNCN